MLLQHRADLVGERRRALCAGGRLPALTRPDDLALFALLKQKCIFPQF